MSIYESIIKAEQNGNLYAVATIVNTVGCTPRSPGVKMLIYADGSTEGTVGGGLAEKLVIEDALTCMRTGQTLFKRYSPQVIKEADLEPDCVKTMDIFIEPGGSAAHLYLLGSGHVAQAVVPLAVQAGFFVSVIDTRDATDYEEYLKDAAEVWQIPDFSDLSSFEPVPGSFYLVCTSSHATDGEALAAALQQDAAYIGMIGAKHKFIPIFNALRKKGYTDDQLKQVYAPVGLDIGGESLNEMAISIVAEMMMVKYGRTAQPMRDLKRAEMFPEG